MNVVFGIAARREDYVNEMHQRMQSAIAYLHEVFEGHTLTYRRRAEASGAVYNANCMNAWQVPTWYERGTEVLSFSAPPVPLDVGVESSSYARTIWEAVDSRSGLARLQPNYCGCHLSDQGLLAWSDAIGLGRCYVVESERFLGVSNHIGALAFFVDGDLTLDELAWQRFAALGWFVGDRTGIQEVRRVPPATCLEIGMDGVVRRTCYADYDGLARQRDTSPDFETVRDQLGTLTRNAASMLVERPIVNLSGGTDSRLTAAAWLSSGNPGIVRTKGTLAGEATVAHDLMRRFGESRSLAAQGVQHDVMDPPPPVIGRALKPIEDRLADAMAIFDGDYAPTSIKANVPAAGGSRRITIGGGGGEIAHAQYYPSHSDLNDLYETPSPMKRVAGNAPWTNCTEATQVALRKYLETEELHARQLGRTDPSALDLFYLRQRFRRWVVAGHQTTSLVLFAAPSFIRMAFDLSPQERVDRVAHRRLTEMFVPQWKDVPYYKAATADLQQITAKGQRLWQQDQSAEYLFDLVASAGSWSNYLSRKSIEAMVDLTRSGGARNAHEQWFFRILWIEGFRTHLKQLRAQTGG